VPEPSLFAFSFAAAPLSLGRRQKDAGTTNQRKDDNYMVRL